MHMFWVKAFSSAHTINGLQRFMVFGYDEIWVENRTHNFSEYEEMCNLLFLVELKFIISNISPFCWVYMFVFWVFMFV